MPLVAQAFLAYAAGLLLGFGGVGLSGGLVFSVAAVVTWRWGRGDLAVLALVVASGAFVARDARTRDARCASAMRAQSRVLIRLDTPLGGGRSARATSTGAGCRVSVRVRAPRAAAAAGTLLDVRGTVARRGSGIEIVAESLQPRAEPPLLDRWRARVGRRIDALFAEDAPLARALLLADAHDLDRGLRDRYADAGIVHMLSVSGLHVAIIANALRAGALGVGVGVLAADGISLATAVSFVLFIGAPPPAVRSVVMLVMLALARRLQRPTSVWGVWGTSCAASLVDPRVVLDLGWQLSVTGMAGLLASAPLARRWCGALDGVARVVVEGMLVTTLASLATAPLVAWTFGRVSLAAVFTNPVAAPLFGVAQPLLFATLALAPIDVAARLLADAARSVLWGIDLVARAGAALPFAAIGVEPTLATAVLLGVAAAALLVAAAGRWPRRPLLVALGALALACWWPTLVRGPGRLELHMLDVGQGDALALRTPRGRWIVVDAGGRWRGGDAGRSIVLPYLRRWGGEVALLATSHPHADHIGGAPRLVEAGVGALWDGGYVETSVLYRDLLAVARETRTPWRRARAGDSASVDGVSIVVLAPDSAWLSELDDANEASLVLRVAYRGASFLLMGDAEAGEEAWLLARYGERLRSTVLKVGHHGSATSSSPAFVRAVGARVALVSVGAGNSYGHPSEEVLRRIGAEGTQLLRTDDEGTIVVSTDGRVIDVRANGATWRYLAGH